MANFSISGINKIMSKLDYMNTAPEKVKKELITAGANQVLSQLKHDAPKDTGQSAAKLKITNERDGEGYLFMDIGIDSSNWNDCKGLYFQHYGFKNKSATIWMTSSFKKSRSKVNKTIKEGLKRELNL